VIRLLSREPWDKSLSHIQRDKTSNNVGSRLKRQSTTQPGLYHLIQTP